MTTGARGTGRERNESMTHRPRLLILCVSVEAATGLCLLLAPALLGRLLLGVEQPAVATVLVRLCGVVLLSLSAACWPERPASDGALRGMLVYNALITVFLCALWIGRELVGILLPPVTAVHAVLAVLLATAPYASATIAAPESAPTKGRYRQMWRPICADDSRSWLSASRS